MMPASNQGVGMNMGFPDVCMTPAAPAPLPIPYPNIAMNAMAMPFIPNIFISFVPGHNMGSKPLMTNGDNAGVAHPLVMQPGGTTMGNPKILLTGLPAEHMLVPTYGNNFNNPVGSKMVPSVTNVLLCRLGATAPKQDGSASWTARALETLALELHDLPAPSLGMTTAPTARSEGLQVLHVRRGGPADRAGVQQHDLLLQVDGQRVGAHDELPLPELHRDVLLQVRRGRAALSLVARWSGNADSVSGELLHGRVGLLTVRRFSLSSADRVDAAVARLVDVGARSLILDLRGNPGGVLAAALQTAGLFLGGDQTVAWLRASHGGRQPLRVEGSGRWSRLPLAVLIDRQSASAAELLAGVLQDTGRARLFGERSFGKGLVTTPAGWRATLLRRHGACLQGLGVLPETLAAPDQSMNEALRTALKWG